MPDEAKLPSRKELWKEKIRLEEINETLSEDFEGLMQRNWEVDDRCAKLEARNRYLESHVKELGTQIFRLRDPLAAHRLDALNMRMSGLAYQIGQFTERVKKVRDGKKARALALVEAIELKKLKKEAPIEMFDRQVVESVETVKSSPVRSPSKVSTTST
ncbi:hypothetical protein BT63DRAFT_424687 [Microthyrium microscopicum]|uniref:Uncharacterized protein n=1 Tax=Microthyrium microscopicum TaxID=703497 RepID=A0A6A6UCX1_9PEZI|nr:hypothetical protein BT63DRAFT_424687 [Microthyrium microscopicum]